MLLERQPGQLTAGEASALRRRACGQKRRLERWPAMAQARRARLRGLGLTAYACPFCRCWHIGHPPAMATVELIARYLRFGSALPSQDDDGIRA